MSALHMYRHFEVTNPEHACEEYFDRPAARVHAFATGSPGGYKLERDEVSAAAATYDEVSVRWMRRRFAKRIDCWTGAWRQHSPDRRQ